MTKVSFFGASGLAVFFFPFTAVPPWPIATDLDGHVTHWINYTDKPPQNLNPNPMLRSKKNSKLHLRKFDKENASPDLLKSFPKNR